MKMLIAGASSLLCLKTLAFQGKFHRCFSFAQQKQKENFSFQKKGGFKVKETVL